MKCDKYCEQAGLLHQKFNAEKFILKHRSNFKMLPDNMGGNLCLHAILHLDNA